MSMMDLVDGEQQSEAQSITAGWLCASWQGQGYYFMFLELLSMEYLLKSPPT